MARRNSLASIQTGPDLTVEQDVVIVNDEDNEISISQIPHSEMELYIQEGLTMDKTIESVVMLQRVLENNEGLSVEGSNDLRLVVQNLLGIKQTSLESSVDGVSTEGFFGVLKTIWDKIYDFIVAFFRSIWKFIRSIFTVEDNVDKEKKNNKDKMKDIKDNDRKIEEPKKHKERFRLATMVGLEGKGVDVDTVINAIEKRYILFSDFTTNSIATLDILDKKLLPNLVGILETLGNEYSTDSDYERVLESCFGVVATLTQIRSTVTEHEVIFQDIPKEARDKISETKGMSFQSLFKAGKDANNLSNMFNLFSSFNQQFATTNNNPRVLLDLDTKDIQVKFATYKVDMKNKKTAMNPIDDSDVLGRLVDSQERYNKDVNFSRIDSLIESITSKTEAIGKRISSSDHALLGKLADSVKPKNNVDRLLDDISKTLVGDLTMMIMLQSAVLDSVGEVDLEKGDGTMVDAIMDLSDRHQGKSVSASDLKETFKDLKVTNSELKDLADLWAKHSGDEVVTQVVDRKEYKNLGTNTSKVISESLRATQDVVAAIGTLGRENYVRFDAEVTSYIKWSQGLYR